MKRYSYKGPIMEFGKCVQHDWTGETVATSERSAKSNRIYQWEKDHNRCLYVKISLPGQLTIIN